VYELFLNGTIRDYESRVAVSGEDEVLIIVRDVTQAKHAEEELKKHRDELELQVAKRTEKLNAMNITLREEIQERERTEIKLKRSQEQLRKLSAHIEIAREEEKTRIAREIHDELGQALSILQMDLNWLEKYFPADSEHLQEKTNAMTKFIDETIRKVQRISQELRPSVLDHLGFAAAIEWQLHEFHKRSEIQCTFLNRCPQLSLDKNRSIILFRVFQETLTNIYRHARAKKVKVILKENKGKLFLHIQDDGRGITKQQLYDPNSLGLVGMREQMHHIHGEVDFFARPGKGTKIIFTIPLAE
jgi:signal transduction histidine kinase